MFPIPLHLYKKGYQCLTQVPSSLDGTYLQLADKGKNPAWLQIGLCIKGNLRYIHIRESAHKEIEAAIQNLLAENYP